jgi:hypothetical protein
VKANTLMPGPGCIIFPLYAAERKSSAPGFDRAQTRVKDSGRHQTRSIGSSLFLERHLYCRLCRHSGVTTNPGASRPHHKMLIYALTGTRSTQ